VFSLPFSIPDELKRRDLAGYYRLFPNGPTGLSKVLVRAYGSAVHKGKPIKKEVGTLLRGILVRALQILLEEHKDKFHQDKTQVNEEQTLLRKGVIKTGPQRDERKREQIAIRLARRYRELLPQLREMRRFIEGKEFLLKATELPTEIARKFQYSWIPFITNGRALNHRLPIPGHDSSIVALSSKGWTVRQLAVGIILCEERDRDAKFRPGPVTIYEKYIAFGNRLIGKED
jgi:hypothetical protein